MKLLASKYDLNSFRNITTITTTRLSFFCYNCLSKIKQSVSLEEKNPNFFKRRRKTFSFDNSNEKSVQN